MIADWGDDRLPDRFWRKVYPEPNTGCWLWGAAQNAAGYGRVRVACVLRYAHRVSYEALVGPIPDGLEIDHRCEQPACVRPDHLAPSTGRDNVLRSRTGPTAVNSRKVSCLRGHALTEENVRIDRRGQRVCMECHRNKSRAAYRAERRTRKHRFDTPGPGYVEWGGPERVRG